MFDGLSNNKKLYEFEQLIHPVGGGQLDIICGRFKTLCLKNKPFLFVSEHVVPRPIWGSEHILCHVVTWPLQRFLIHKAWCHDARIA